jgi:hypothetical protein
MASSQQPEAHSQQPAAPSARRQIVTLLQRMGFVVGGMHVLAVPARQSGILRSTPVSVLEHAGQRYIVAADEGAEWVLDARARGRGVLRSGRVDEHIALIELPLAERIPILHALPRLMPGNARAIARRHGVSPDPDALATLAAHCPVFRVERR